MLKIKVKRVKQESAHRQTDGHTHGHYQTYYLPCDAVDNDEMLAWLAVWNEVHLHVVHLLTLLLGQLLLYENFELVTFLVLAYRGCPENKVVLTVQCPASALASSAEHFHWSTCWPT